MVMPHPGNRVTLKPFDSAGIVVLLDTGSRPVIPDYVLWCVAQRGGSGCGQPAFLLAKRRINIREVKGIAKREKPEQHQSREAVP